MPVRSLQELVPHTAKVAASLVPWLGMKASLKELAYVPGSFSVASGVKIVFKNNTGFPHNIIFDKDEALAGIDVLKISMNDEDLLNAAGVWRDLHPVTLTLKG
ncbi:unnamed protein product [Ilex paraguariensis]|uniref:Blue (type 1) copper domain-containing protein n=1 Tax=Ilex paraguariensis TaxID=185542 RepID=A0ABC8UA32_9AQUA